MLYNMMMNQMNQNIRPDWPDAESYLNAIRLPGNNPLRIPITGNNTIVTGTSGYGKTLLTKALVRSVFDRDPNRFAVFFQIKPDDFTAEFLRSQDKLICISDKLCQPQNLFCWNLIKEIRSYPVEEWDSELEQMTSILFADIMEDKRNILWSQAAKNTFEAFVKVILYCYEDCPSNRRIISDMKDMRHDELMQFLAEYQPNIPMLKNNFHFDPMDKKPYVMNKKSQDILFFLQNVLDKFKGSFLSDGQDTIYDYMHGCYGERLFIIHDHRMRYSSQIFERYFMRYIVNEMLSLSSDFKGKMLLVLDEIDKIEYDFGLTQAATLGRQFGLQVILATQSLESLYAIAPEKAGEHLTNASLAGFGVNIAFHPGDPYTIETLQTFYGDELKERMVMPVSRYDKPSVIAEYRPKVENSDFAKLKIGEFYIKLLSEDPVKAKLIFK